MTYNFQWQFMDFRSALLHYGKHSTHPRWFKQNIYLKDIRQLTESPGEPAWSYLARNKGYAGPAPAPRKPQDYRPWHRHPQLTPPALTTGLFSGEGSSKLEK